MFFEKFRGLKKEGIKGFTFVMAAVVCVGCTQQKVMTEQSAVMGAGAKGTIQRIGAADKGQVQELSYITTSKKRNASKIELEIVFKNSWESNGLKYAQFDVVVTNHASSEVSDWCVQLPKGGKAKIEQVWNAVYTESKGTFSFKAVDYNQKISPEGNITFGCIISGADSIKIDSAKLSFNQNHQSRTENSSQKDNDGQNDVPKPTTDDWLHTSGSKILDANGREVWLTGVNWFGYNTGTNTFDGLWTADLNTSLKAIADRGFNLLRVPISSELVLEWAAGKAPKANFNQATNSYLTGKNSLQIFDYVVGQCRANGIKIMIDIHSAKTDAMGHMKPVWYDGKITEAKYLQSLSWMAERYKNDDTIIAYDLKNEPHGKPNESPRAIWNGSKSADNWKYIAEKAAHAVLSKNPNVLVLVEGIEIYPKNIKKNGSFASQNSQDYYFNWWGGNLRGVKDYPINLGRYQSKLVYSPHDYGPSVYEQPWFKEGYTFDSLYKNCWRDNWMYIYKDNIAPLLIGEWGGFMKEPNLKWMTYLRKLIKDNKLNHTFWCFNANSGDTGGLVLDDFKTWDEKKYAFVKEVLWQKNGKFVGLDHQIPLGKNGISLGEY